jgi:hypothetical protein
MVARNLRKGKPRAKPATLTPDAAANARLDAIVFALQRRGQYEESDLVRLYWQGRGVAGEQAYLRYLKQADATQGQDQAPDALEAAGQ